MTSSELFYGLPQILWDELCEKAEDLLHEKEIGQHILGLYAIGPRMYGLESEDLQLLCIYIDSPAKFLNPLGNPGWSCGRRKEFVGEGASCIYYVDIHDWISTIHSGSSFWMQPFFENFPARGTCLYADKSMINIANLVDEYFIPAYHFGPQFVLCNHFENTKEEYLYARTKSILADTGLLLPCVNPEWDKVGELSLPSKEIKEKDLLLREQLLESGNVEYSIAAEVSLYLGDQVIRQDNRYREDVNKSKMKEAASIVEELYRFQL